MRTQFLGFYSACDRAIQALDCRGRIIGTAVALAAARLASLPSSEVDAPGNHYNLTVLSQVNELLGQFNEQVVFDVRCALTAAREFWMLRYEAAHPCRRPLTDLDKGFYDNIAGVPKWVSEDNHCFNNEHKLEILPLAQLAYDLLLMESAHV
ncbi:hypothetical protein [Paraburkholderia sp. BCC1886]|uniref:hypothetical protein n=1 Tax=Paraburkholderia sp. BCC1886 TaxID=2562670 RepID=UPI001182F9E8|nr:hypothetical protein [Paraburkholderia sp. BCC1886]